MEKARPQDIETGGVCLDQVDVGITTSTHQA